MGVPPICRHVSSGYLLIRLSQIGLLDHFLVSDCREGVIYDGIENFGLRICEASFALGRPNPDEQRFYKYALRVLEVRLIVEESSKSAYKLSRRMAKLN